MMEGWFWRGENKEVLGLSNNYVATEAYELLDTYAIWEVAATSFLTKSRLDTIQDRAVDSFELSNAPV